MVTINRKEFLEYTKFLKPAIGDNESRKNLTVLNIESVNRDIIHFTAADSFIIKRVKFEQIGGSGFKNFSIHKKVLSLFESICRLENRQDNVEISSSVLKCGDLALKYVQSETEYPNLERLIATEYDKKPVDNYSGLNAYFLEKALTGFSKTQKEVVKVWFKNKNAPVKITSQCGNYTAIIMAVRVRW